MRRLIGVSAMAVIATVVGITPAWAASLSIDHGDFSSIAGLTLTGDAVQSGSVVRLTDAVDDQSGSVWSNVHADPTQNFSTSFTLDMHDANGCQADGIVFVIQNAPDGPAAGESGGDLGYGGISNSVGVEFDTYQNEWDPNDNHVAFLEGGSLDHSTFPSDWVNPLPAGPTLYGQPVYAWVSYVASTHQLKLYASNSSTKPSSPLLDRTVDIASQVGGSDALVGFTGATGSCNSQQDVVAWHFSGSRGTAATQTTVTASTAASVYSQPVTYTAKVARIDGGSGGPTGTVTFYDRTDGDVQLGDPVPVSSAGVATLKYAGFHVGNGTVRAVYTSTDGLGTSQGAFTEHVTPVDTTISFTPVTGSVAYGSPVYAVVSAVSPGTAKATGSIDVSDSGSDVSGGFQTLTSGRSLVPYSAMAVGSHSLEGSYSPDSGDFNASTSASASSMTVTQGTPTIKLTSTQNPATQGSDAADVATLSGPTGTAKPSGTVDFEVTTGGVTSDYPETISGGSASFPTADLPGGSYDVVASYGGDSNWVAVTSTHLIQTIKPAPVVTGVSPSSGPIAGGTSVTLTGTGFSGATAVAFGTGGASGTALTVVDDSHITVVSPAHSAGQVNVFVTTPVGTSAAVAADRFTYLPPPPVVSSVSPSSGPAAGGTSVTITGSGFTGATGVSFGTGHAAASYTVVSSTTITAVSPAGSVGAVNVFVTTAGGTSSAVTADRFTYLAAPVVTAVSPSTGPIEGGTSVTISGKNFTGATGVMFGSGGSLVAVTVLSDTQLQVVTPAHSAGVLNVFVVTPGGTSAAVTADRFTYS